MGGVIFRVAVSNNASMYVTPHSHYLTLGYKEIQHLMGTMDVVLRHIRFSEASSFHVATRSFYARALGTADYGFLTTVRQPIDRYISDFYYYVEPNGRGSGGGQRRRTAATTLAAHVAAGGGANRMAREFALRSVEATLEFVGGEMFEDGLFLPVELLDYGLALLAVHCGWRLPQLVYLPVNCNAAGVRRYGNVTLSSRPGMAELAEQDPALVNRIAALNGLDAVLYGAARSSLLSRLAAPAAATATAAAAVGAQGAGAASASGRALSPAAATSGSSGVMSVAVRLLAARKQLEAACRSLSTAATGLAERPSGGGTSSASSAANGTGTTDTRAAPSPEASSSPSLPSASAFSAPSTPTSRGLLSAARFPAAVAPSPTPAGDAGDEALRNRAAANPLLLLLPGADTAGDLAGVCAWYSLTDTVYEKMPSPETGRVGLETRVYGSADGGSGAAAEAAGMASWPVGHLLRAAERLLAPFEDPAVPYFHSLVAVHVTVPLAEEREFLFGGGAAAGAVPAAAGSVAATDGRRRRRRLSMNPRDRGFASTSSSSSMKQGAAAAASSADGAASAAAAAAELDGLAAAVRLWAAHHAREGLHHLLFLVGGLSARQQEAVQQAAAAALGYCDGQATAGGGAGGAGGYTTFELSRCDPPWTTAAQPASDRAGELEAAAAAAAAGGEEGAECGAVFDDLAARSRWSVQLAGLSYFLHGNRGTVRSVLMSYEGSLLMSNAGAVCAPVVPWRTAPRGLPRRAERPEVAAPEGSGNEADASASAHELGKSTEGSESAPGLADEGPGSPVDADDAAALGDGADGPRRQWRRQRRQQWRLSREGPAHPAAQAPPPQPVGEGQGGNSGQERHLRRNLLRDLLGEPANSSAAEDSGGGGAGGTGGGPAGACLRTPCRVDLRDAHAACAWVRSMPLLGHTRRLTSGGQELREGRRAGRAAGPYRVPYRGPDQHRLQVLQLRPPTQGDLRRGLAEPFGCSKLPLPRLRVPWCRASGVAEEGE